MALTEPLTAAIVPASARPALTFPLSDIPYDALARLSHLRHEAGEDRRLLQFLARAPSACLILMLTGAVGLAWASAGIGNASLKSDFIWTLGVLAGIAAIVRTYIRGFAASPRPVPLLQTVHDLRVLLLYTGAAWGMGVFLVMPDRPAPALAVLFAAPPCLALALLLKDIKGAAAFSIPVTVSFAVAAIVGDWPLAGPVAGVIGLSGLGSCFLPVLQTMLEWRRDELGEPAPH